LAGLAGQNSEFDGQMAPNTLRARVCTNKFPPISAAC
jgi:hypothetical protein